MAILKSFLCLLEITSTSTITMSMGFAPTFALFFQFTKLILTQHGNIFRRFIKLMFNMHMVPGINYGCPFEGFIC